MHRTVNSVAPIRICDLGGWTDTWFAEHGRVLNIAAYAYVPCQMLPSVLKHAPDVLARTAPRLPSGLVEADQEVAHSGDFGISKPSGKVFEACILRNSRRCSTHSARLPAVIGSSGSIR